MGSVHKARGWVVYTNQPGLCLHVPSSQVLLSSLHDDIQALLLMVRVRFGTKEHIEGRLAPLISFLPSSRTIQLLRYLIGAMLTIRGAQCEGSQAMSAN